MLLAAGALLGLAAAAVAACWWGAGIILHPPAMSPMWIFPEQFRLAYEKISFCTRDGLTLRGWFLPSPRGDLRTLLMCHGWGDNKGELLKQTFFLNSKAGFNLLYFDFRSHGESDGEITSIGPLETADFDAAADWLRREKPACAARAGVFGLSMGAAVAAVRLGERPDLRCAVLESPYSDYRGVVRRWAWNNLRVPYLPLVALTLLLLRRRVGDPSVDRFDPVASIGRAAPRPLLLLAGGRDALMPEEDVRRVFNAAGEPKSLWVVPEAWHARCWEAAGAEYERRVTAFFEAHL